MERPTAGLREILFPRRGFSATEILLAANIAVAALLLAAWGRDYSANIRQYSWDWWHSVRADRAYGWFLPTLFLHAGPGHLASNMASLLAASAAVEFLAGGGWTLFAYLVTGLGAAWVSYAGHGAPPLSVGSSGAIFGLLGCTVSFIIRRRNMFNYAKRWKVWRVYVPLFILLFVPAIANADVHAHAGGLACGLILGIWLPPHARVARLGGIDSMSDDEPEGQELDT
ncbi:MAG TPA: rhomboid family intramembrane serine protease [Candidatus Angelobacter sp.]|nr:rhomboid family intramembrane serine protease [Candidatus Angelobacter sp.]